MQRGETSGGFIRARSVGNGCGAALVTTFAIVVAIGFGSLVAIGFGSLAGCQAAAGMFCQQESDCRVGLICQKPPGTATDTSFGVCAPARRGLGESCTDSEDCDSGLHCSNLDGVDNGDERHGMCQPNADGGAADLGSSDL